MDYIDNDSESIGKKYFISLVGWAIIGAAAYGIHKELAPGKAQRPVEPSHHAGTLEKRVSNDHDF